MQPPGLAQVAAAKADGRWAKAYSMTNTKAPDDLLAAIRAKPKALAMYEALSSQNRFALIFRTVGMKTAAGREKKIAGFVEMLAKGETIYPNGKAAPARRAKARRAAPASPAQRSRSKTAR
jgi:uncharacterized protein YdeI (YjbR/CyaY-like superfamily)